MHRTPPSGSHQGSSSDFCFLSFLGLQKTFQVPLCPREPATASRNVPTCFTFLSNALDTSLSRISDNQTVQGDLGGLQCDVLSGGSLGKEQE